MPNPARCTLLSVSRLPQFLAPHSLGWKCDKAQVSQKREWSRLSLAPSTTFQGFTNLTLSASSSSSHFGDVQGEEGKYKEDMAQRRTGALQRIPTVAKADELLAGGVRRAKGIGRSIKIKNEAAKARNLAARQMDALMKEISTPLNQYLKGFPEIKKLHPFDAALLDLTVGEVRYAAVKRKVASLRLSTLEVGRSYASRAANAANKKDAEQIAVEGFETMEKVVKKGGKCIQDLIIVARDLRKLPYLDPSIPTIALVGAPNVGKSSLVQAISSGKPEICDYPFTTRTVKMGHFYVNRQQHQITDTPGLLRRSDAERNAMENLTLATLGHLPTSVVFVIDLTEECGMSISDQLALLSELQQRYPEKAWINVFSKEDLLRDVFHAADEKLTAMDDRIISDGDDRLGAVEAVLRLPGALRVSCLTKEGLESFKAKVIDALHNGKKMEQA